MSQQYSFEIDVSPNISSANPQNWIKNPIRGDLTRVYITFRDGALNSVGVRLLEGGVQFAPWPNGWYRGNKQTLTWQGPRRLQGPPYNLTIQGYSDALDWSHQVIFLMEFG